jgi:hypothetical protein
MDIYDKTKLALGKTGEKMTDQQVSELVASYQNLIDYFLERQEIKIFGSPINEMLAK